MAGEFAERSLEPEEAERMRPRGSVARIAMGLLALQLVLLIATLALAGLLPQFAPLGEIAAPQQCFSYFLAIAALVVAERAREPQFAAGAALCGMVAGLIVSTLASFLANWSHAYATIVETVWSADVKLVGPFVAICISGLTLATILLLWQNWLVKRERPFGTFAGMAVWTTLCVAFLFFVVWRALLDGGPFWLGFEDALRFERAGAVIGLSLLDRLVTAPKELWTIILLAAPPTMIAAATTFIAAERLEPESRGRDGPLLRLVGLAAVAVAVVAVVAEEWSDEKT
ncbi:MAG: hypothetical protein GC152_00420 [Alphaproteobacteria bacterium]|nr:hypothetical protein [Alphaproteobacteria bacterium]